VTPNRLVNRYEGATMKVKKVIEGVLCALAVGIFSMGYAADDDILDFMPAIIASQSMKPRPAVNLVAFQSTRNGTWYSQALNTFPQTQFRPEAIFRITDTPFNNRKNGAIAPTLVSGYFFIQWNISAQNFDQYDHTIHGLFLKSALLSFVDYPNNKVLDWWRHSSVIATDITGVLQVCNQNNIPVFLQINYSDYIPGPFGTGVASLISTDNIANTVSFLTTLKNKGIQIEGVTFGNEIEDDSGFGSYKPTIWNCDLIGRFIAYAKGIKNAHPDVKIYAFDSGIMAARCKLWAYWDYFTRIREAEIAEGKVLLDGFIFTESYVYIDQYGSLLPSQLILDDTESLYRDTPVYRFDYDGTTHPNPDSAYIPSVITKTKEIFGRDLEIGITEYLPAIPYQMGEIDTSRYSDFDFIIHYSDIMGIYAEHGLDIVAKIMFGDSTDMHKSYFDREGNLSPNYPVHEQLADYFKGTLLKVTRSVSYDNLKVKVYAAKTGTHEFIMVLNKDTASAHTVVLSMHDGTEITLNLPRRSYTSLLKQNDQIIISGIGN
jgi:hypothetical protein